LTNKVKISLDQCRSQAFLTSNQTNREARSVPVLLSTGQRGIRFDWETGTRFFEELSMDPAHVRLRETVPLMDNHNRSTESHLGIVRDISLRNGQLRGTTYFDSHELANKRFESVAGGFLTDTSIGYRAYKYERVSDAPDPFDPLKNIPVLRVVDWELLENSLVAVGFDSEAKFNRSEAPASANIYDVQVNRSIENKNETAKKEVKQMPPENIDVPKTPEIDMEKLRAEIATQERSRVSEILQVCRGLKREELAQGFIESGSSIAEVNSDLVRKLSESNYQPAAPVTSRPLVVIGESADSKRDSAMMNALLNRANPSMYKLEDMGRAYRGYSLLDLAREFSDVKAGPADLILTRALMTTSSFKNLLNTVAERTLQDQFKSVPRTFEPFVRTGLVNDFKPVGRSRLTDMAGLIKIPEHGEFKATEISDTEGQTVRVETFGRKFGITRQAFINDDLGAFDELPKMIGRKAATLESKLIYSILKSNPVLNTGYALFSVTHGNLAGTPAALSDASLTAAMLAYRGQTTEDDEEFIDVAPRYLLVPPALEATARKIMATINATAIGDLNLYSGAFQIIVENRLAAAAGGSDTAWYLMPDRSEIETIELVNLRGFEGIQIQQSESDDILGVNWKAYYDVGASPIEYRGMYKNAGA